MTTIYDIQSVPPERIVSDLTYSSYKANRGYDPTITPERWKAVYGASVDAMEERYIREQKEAKN